MKSMRAFWCALVLATTVSSAAVAQKDEASGNHWNQFCTSEQMWQRLTCVGFINGVLDGYFLAQSEAGSAKPYCIPREATKEQMVNIVSRHLRHYPERTHLPFALLTVQALRAAFPCR